jgi:hypothetical protein
VPGTGFFGTLQRFGSIYVNDVRIRYPDDVAVVIDGLDRSPRDLRIGQVVRTVGRPSDGGGADAADLATERIDVVSEVIGPIETVSADELRVLGQRVAIDGLAPSDDPELKGGFRPGLRVAVSGLRSPDGVIVASLVEPAGQRGDQVAGCASLHGWTLRTGDLSLLGVASGYEGRRIIAVGRPGRRGLLVSRVRVDAMRLGPDVQKLSIETFVERKGAQLVIGSNAATVNRTVLSLPATGSPSLPGGPRRRGWRAVLNAEVGPSHGLRFDSIQPEARAGGRSFGGGVMRLRQGPGGTSPGFGGSGGGPDRYAPGGNGPSPRGDGWGGGSSGDGDGWGGSGRF